MRVLDFGRFGDNAFLAMELILGQTLRGRMRKGALTVEEAVGITRDVLEGLAALHRHGIAHRDVKPSNILLDREGRAKLADFGLVTKWADEQPRATQSQAIVGTLEYVSPEQALGEELDGRSDLYALGVVLYELLSGNALHGARSSLGTLVAHLTKPAPDVRASRDSVPEWLATITARLLEKDRAHRYPTAEAVLADICSRSAARPAGNPVARRRFPIAATLAATLVAAMALDAVTWRFSPSTAETVPTPFLCTADVKGGMLRGLDEDDRVLWRRDLGTPLDERAFTADALTRNPKLLVTDIDGDGSREALLTASVEAGGLPMLLAFNSDGSERFRKQAGRTVKYGDEEYEGFNANSIYSLIDHQGKRRLFLLGTHRQWFPSVLEELDSQGRVLAEYFASGAHTTLRRLPVLERDILALGGYHNETRGGSMTLLDLGDITGRAPGADRRYVCSTCLQRNPLGIVVVPRSDVLAAVGGPEAAANVEQITVVDRNVLDFLSRHGGFKDPRGYDVEVTVSYNFAPDLSRLLDVRPSESLKTLHNDLFKNGRIDHPYGAADIAALGRAVKWDGRRWAPIADR